MDVHFNARKVKFEDLNKLTDGVSRSQSIHTVNLFINIDDMLHSLHRPQTEYEIQVSGGSVSQVILQLTSNILNLGAHYREWALRKGWYPYTFFVYTSAMNGPFENSMYVEKYRDYFIQTNSPLNQKFGVLNQAIPKALALVANICQYIPHVYAIDSSFQEPSVMPYTIAERFSKRDWNFIVTRDRYDFQYVNHPRWSVIYPDYAEESVLVTPANLWSVIAKKEKIEPEYQKNYPLSAYPIAVAIVGNPYRSLPRMRGCGWKTFYSILSEAEVQSYDSTSAGFEELLLLTLRKRFQTRRIGNLIDIVNASLECIDVRRQSERGSEITETFVTTMMTDIPDYENLVTIDRCYFTKFPINIPFLTHEKPALVSNFKFTK